jgi:hypothetical protein
LRIKHSVDGDIAPVEQVANSATNGRDAQNVTSIWDMLAGEYVELEAFQTSGGNLDVVSTAKKTPEFMMIRIA